MNWVSNSWNSTPEEKPILPIAYHPDHPNPFDLLPKSGEQVLLIHPSVFDTRLYWPNWQQPVLLLKLAAYAHLVGASAQLIDMLHRPAGVRLRRQQIGKVNLDGVSVNKWRFGLLKPALVNQLRELARTGRQPSKVYVECFTTFWWEGAAEVIQLVKERFPTTQVILLGAYASLGTDHARVHTRADIVLSGNWPQIAVLRTDISLYNPQPNFAYVPFGSAQRTAEDIVDEVVSKSRQYQVHHFAFVDEAIATRFGELYRAVLELLVDRALGVNFYAVGNIAPSDFVTQPDLANLMKRAGFKQIFFADDRNIAQDQLPREQLIEDYKRAADLCSQAGFPARTEALNAGICLGRLGEDLKERARLAALVAHHVGSVIFWPYQPTSCECPGIPLEEQNGKLFPFRTANGYTYHDYLNVMGVGTVLNSKYRTRTFDFLGNEMVSRLFRESISRRSWEPNPEVKGSLKLPMRLIEVIEK